MNGDYVTRIEGDATSGKIAVRRRQLYCRSDGQRAIIDRNTLEALTRVAGLDANLVAVAGFDSKLAQIAAWMRPAAVSAATVQDRAGAFLEEHEASIHC